MFSRRQFIDYGIKGIASVFGLAALGVQPAWADALCPKSKFSQSKDAKSTPTDPCSIVWGEPSSSLTSCSASSPNGDWYVYPCKMVCPAGCTDVWQVRCAACNSGRCSCTRKGPFS